MTKNIKLDEIKFDRANANKGTARGRGMIEQSIREFGFADAGTLDKHNIIIGGNKRTEVAGEIGMDDAIIIDVDGTKPVFIRRPDMDLSDPDDDRARRLAYVLNRSGEVSLAWDAEQMLADLNAGVDFSGIFNQDELDALLAGLIDDEPVADPGAQVDKADELRQKWNTSLGQLWLLGDHRLICGDCTDAATVARLMGGERAAITFTSPPYNAGVSAQLSGNTNIGDNLYKDEYDDNQTSEDYLSLLCKFTDNALIASNYVFVNIQPLAGNKRALIEYWFKFVDKFADVAIWDKVNAAPELAWRVMDSRFEFVIVFSDNASRAIGTRDFRGMVHNVYTGQPQRNNEYASSHAATFPTELPSHFIETFTNRSDIVYEPFDGTGTTIIACTQLTRRCYAAEISPAYIAVALERWSVATGRTPELID